MRVALLLGSMLMVAVPAHASEIFGGVYAHDVKTPLDHSGSRAVRTFSSAGAAELVSAAPFSAQTV